MKSLCFVILVVFQSLVSLPLLADESKQRSDAYDESLASWKNKIVVLQQIRDELALAKDEEVTDLRIRYLEAIEDGKKALRTFTDAAERELSSKGKTKRQLLNFSGIVCWSSKMSMILSVHCELASF